MKNESTNVTGETSVTMGSTSDKSLTPTEQANKALRELWKDQLNHNQWPEGIEQLWPMQYPEMEKGKVLFIGLNPSQGNNEDKLSENDYSTVLDKNEKLSEILKREEDALKNHPYFGKFSEFFPNSNESGSSRQWNHIDLLAVRHTKQKELTTKLKLSLNEHLDMDSFAGKQVKIALKLARDLEPTCIVVVNAFAAHLMEQELLEEESYQLENESCGHHWVTLANKRIPCFFSGMLTGSHALDTYSRKRLIWHVRKALHLQDGEREEKRYVLRECFYKE